MNIAIILAAGSGTRIGGEIPKQFVSVAGKMVIEYSIARFQAHPAIDEIAIVTSEFFLEKLRQLASNPAYSKVKAVLLGGSERYRSSWAAIQHYAQQTDAVLLIHDAARPLISQQIITDVIAVMQGHQAAVVAIPATDTVIYSSDNHCITNIPPRKQMYYAQTPQAFRVETIRQAFEIGMQDPDFNPTDDSGVVLKYLPEVPVYIVNGEPANKKITYHDDLAWLVSQIQNQ